MSDSTKRLANRYGQTPENAARSKIFGWLAAGGFAVILGAWLWWGAVLETPSQLQYRDVAHTIVSETNVVVNYEVTTAPKELLEALPSHPKNVPLMMPVSLDWYATHRAEALELYMELLSE